MRTAAEFTQVISRYRSIYYQFPISSKADDALLAVAELYQLMGSDFAEPAYFDRAAKTYVFLEREYPASPHSAGGLFTAGEIYLNDLNDPKTAEEIFQDFLKRYPYSKKARNARARLADLREQSRQARKSARSSDSASPASATASPLVESEQSGISASAATSSSESTTSSNATTQKHGLAKSSQPAISPGAAAVWLSHAAAVVVNEIRFWNTETYTRLVISISGEAKYQEGRLENPPRIFLDIQNAKLSPTLAGRSFSLNDGYLSSVRFGQVKEQVARVVLDLDRITSYQISQLSGPSRILIEVQGSPRATRQAGRTRPSWQIRQGDPLPDEMSPDVSLDSSRKRVESASAAEKLAAVKEPAVSVATDRRPPAPGKRENDAKRTQPGRGEAASTVKTRDAALPAGKGAENESTNIAAARAALPKSDGTRSLIRMLGLKVGRIVIDPGHGGHDTGTVGPSGLQEKDLVLDIALKLKMLVEERLGSEVILTRTEDTFVPLEERTAIANQNQADLFISIHANSSRNRQVSGVETFFLNFATSADIEEIAARENASSQKTIFELQDLVQKIALKEKVEESREFAHIVQKSMTAHLQKTRKGTRDRGVKQAPFIVLIGANMPSILSEVSFVSNPADERLLKSSNYRQKLAEALCHGIEAYAEALGGIRTAKNIPQKVR